MSAGSIIVDLLMRTGSFETDTKRAVKSLKDLEKGAEKTARAFKASFAGNLAAGFADSAIRGLARIPGLMVDVVKSSIDAADHLNDLSKSTGVSVEALGGIGFAASQAGSSLDGVASALGKLNITLAKAASGNQEATAALKALGINAIDPLTGKTIAADQALIKMADTFVKAGDSPEKFRAASAALGKQYQELVPLLADGGKALLENIQYYQRFGGVSTETAQKADEFNDTIGKFKLLVGSFGRTLSAELLTPLSGIAEAFLKAKESGDGFKGTASVIKDVIVGIATGASFVVNSLEAMSARLDGLVRKAQELFAAGERAREKTRKFDPLGISVPFVTGLDSNLSKAFGQIDEDTAAGIAKAQKAYDDFVARLEKGGSTSGPAKGGRIPGIPDSSAVAAAEALLKKQLDGLLRMLKSQTDAQQNQLAFSNRFLEGEYQDHLISLEAFFGSQQDIRKRALKVQLDEQDAIIKAEQEFAKRTSDPKARAEANLRVDEARERKSRLVIKTQQEEALAQQQHARDVRELAKAYDDVNAQVLELEESFKAVAEIRFDAQFRSLKEIFTAEGNQAGLEAIGILRGAALAQADFKKASLETSRTLDSLAHTEARIALAQQTGAIGSIEALVKYGEARRALIPVYEAEVAALEAIAKANPKNFDFAKRAEEARLALDQLKASVDPLAESLNKAFGEGFNTALGDFVTSTKTASEAWKSFTRSLLNDLLRLGSQSITESLFGGSSGLGKLVSDALGSARGQKSSAQDDGTTGAIQATIGSLAGLTSSATAATGAVGQQTAALTGNVSALSGLSSILSSVGDAFTEVASDFASAALKLLSSFSSSSSSSTADTAGDLANYFAGFMADGGSIPPGKFAVVGERGPELALGGQSGKTIVPNNKLGGSRNITVNVTQPQGATKETGHQFGAAIASRLAVSDRRNN